MESLLKLSGLLGGEDDGRTDLGTLERRLADKTHAHSNGGTPTRESTASSNSGSQPRMLQSPHSTPQTDKIPTPVQSPPDQPPQEKEEAVEELSDMMCSLVTNNCGETRYIGKGPNQRLSKPSLIGCRIFVRFLYFLSEGHTMGQRKDRRHLLPGHDRFRRCLRCQMGVLETRSLRRHVRQKDLCPFTTSA